MLLLEQRFFLGDHNLIYNDKMSMANGVEIRVPYLDHRLIDYVFGIDYKYLYLNGNNKHLLRESMKKILTSKEEILIVYLMISTIIINCSVNYRNC